MRNDEYTAIGSSGGIVILRLSSTLSHCGKPVMTTIGCASYYCDDLKTGSCLDIYRSGIEVVLVPNARKRLRAAMKHREKVEAVRTNPLDGATRTR